VKITDIRHSPSDVARFEAAGYWTKETTNEALENLARDRPDDLAIDDGRVRLTWAEMRQRVRRLAAHFVSLGLTSDDAIAIQLPNWSEFAIAVNAAIMAGVPFCQVHSDFRSREIEFVLSFTKAAVFICPVTFRKFDYLAMVAEIRPRLPSLRYLMAVASNVPGDVFDVRAFLDGQSKLAVPEATLEARRPKGNDLARVAFTSGTTGDPKAVLNLHNTTNCAIRFINRDHRLGPEDVILLMLPVGLNWGLFNMLQAVMSGASLIMLEQFSPAAVLELIEKHRISYLCCAPAHVVSLLASPDLAKRDVSSLRVAVTGGASCPIEVIREFRRRMPGTLLELYGMLEAGLQSCTLIDDDPDSVVGTVGKPIKEVESIVVNDNGDIAKPSEIGEILSRGPSVTIGYYNNSEANARAFTSDGWFHTGDLGTFDSRGYLRIVGRKKEMLIRGGANIYPREIEEVLYQHPKIRDAAVIGVPDPRLGEKTCACVVPKDGETITFDEIIEFLRPKIATYKLPEVFKVFSDLPRTPTGKIQKGPLLALVLQGGAEVRAEGARPAQTP
jgi:acyl-CoA synthetase (AMP-forming)/AMP-acid ligase II